MKVMLEEMERHYGKRPIIYTTVDFYEAILVDGAFMDYPIWVRSTKHHPSVKYGSRPWHFWQYQSDGSVAGISATSIATRSSAPGISGKPSSASRTGVTLARHRLSRNNSRRRALRRRNLPPLRLNRSNGSPRRNRPRRTSLSTSSPARNRQTTNKRARSNRTSSSNRRRVSLRRATLARLS